MGFFFKRVYRTKSVGGRFHDSGYEEDYEKVYEEAFEEEYEAELWNSFRMIASPHPGVKDPIFL